MPLYFAYGSNLLSHRLIARCASAQVVSTAVLPGHRLKFSKYSFIDGSGKATLTPATEDAHGVLYRLNSADMGTLDAIEGVGKGYERLSVTLHARKDEVSAETYLATDPYDGQAPFDWYLALILAGMIEHGLPMNTRRRLAQTRPVADPEEARPGRVAALAALAAAGHGELAGFLAAHGVNAA